MRGGSRLVWEGWSIVAHYVLRTALRSWKSESSVYLHPHSDQPNLGARGRVLRLDGVIQSDESRVIGLVRPRNRYQRPQRAVASARDLDLGARDIDLHSPDGLVLVQGDTLHSNEVRDALRDDKINNLFVCRTMSAHPYHHHEAGHKTHTIRRPVPTTRGLHSISSSNFGPHVTAAVPGVDIRRVGNARHVETDRTKVRHLRVRDEA